MATGSLPQSLEAAICSQATGVACDVSAFSEYQSEFRTVIRTRFLKIKDALDTVTYSLIRTRDPDLADELYLRIKEEGCSFDDLSDYSEGPENQCHCCIGPRPLNQGHPELVSRLKSLPIGVLNRPFSIRSTSIILRVDQRTSAKFQDWSDSIAVRLCQDCAFNI